MTVLRICLLMNLYFVVADDYQDYLTFAIQTHLRTRWSRKRASSFCEIPLL